MLVRSLAVIVGEFLRGTDVTDVEERGLVEPDLDERRLHARQHPLDPSQVDVADDAAVAMPLDEDLGDDAVFDE
ncbi:MAG: hypothetical protein ACK559_39860, partial [bacterium]